jgi:CubicO group peptidase (beta-lactamase class C family)
MQHYRVPGVSVAIIQDCRIVDARGFGTYADGTTPITTRTLFQAGSISKVVTAITALRLMEQRKLSLDSDIRPQLTSWKLSAASGEAPAVTLRQLLNHTAGLNEVGGRGYERGTPLPRLPQMLDGTNPANTPAIRVERAPGSRWAYSSGGYYVAQALLTDRTGEPFADLAAHLVLRPAGMTGSSFQQPLEGKRQLLAATAVGPDGTAMPGGWRDNPELAAGGLWSTPSDLARLAIAIAKDVRGDGSRLLRPSSARELMARGLGNWGLGIDLGPAGGTRRFGHTGHNTGFVSEFVMYPESCQGAVVMTNADQGGWLITEVLRAIEEVYRWPDRKPLPIQSSVPLTDLIANRFVGTYRLRDFPAETFTISRTSTGGLYWARTGHIGRDLLAESDRKLVSPDSRMALEATGPTSEQAMVLELSFGGGENIAERVN